MSRKILTTTTIIAITLLAALAFSALIYPVQAQENPITIESKVRVIASADGTSNEWSDRLEKVVAGNELEIQITVSNNSSSDVSALSINSVLPSNIELTSETSSFNIDRLSGNSSQNFVLTTKAQDFGIPEGQEKCFVHGAVLMQNGEQIAADGNEICIINKPGQVLSGSSTSLPQTAMPAVQNPAQKASMLTSPNLYITMLMVGLILYVSFREMEKRVKEVS